MAYLDPLLQDLSQGCNAGMQSHLKALLGRVGFQVQFHGCWQDSVFWLEASVESLPCRSLPIQHLTTWQ